MYKNLIMYAKLECGYYQKIIKSSKLFGFKTTTDLIITKSGKNKIT